MGVSTDLSKIAPGIRLSEAAPDRLLYARDLWPRQLIRLRAHQAATPKPTCVAWPTTSEHVQRIIEYARDEALGVVPFGAGSGVCGAIEPDTRTIVLDLKCFDDWKISEDGAEVDVGAGVLGIHLENQLGELGYTVGHFPSSILCSTVGGWVAARGAGQCSGLYGKIEDMVVGLDTVLGSGERVDMQSRSRGPDLVPLMIGSEGTLGVVTRARLRLHPRPQKREFLAFAFSTVEAGSEALREIYQRGLRPSVARLYDALDTALVAPKPSSSGAGSHGPPDFVLKAALAAPRAVNRAVEALEGKLLNRCQLILVFEGPAGIIREDAERATELLTARRGEALGEAPAKAWFEHRYSVSYRQAPIFRMGAFSDTMEVAAPWSKLMDVYREVRRALGKHVVVLAHLSHAYPDGSSIYFTFSARARDDMQALEWYDALWPEALQAAHEAGGTLSHHHGVGRSKAPVLRQELGHGVTMVQHLMRAWDPSGIMNPGALVPKATDTGGPIACEARVGPCFVDEQSLLADFDASLTLDQAENLLARRGLTLGVTGDGASRLAEWLGYGMPGTRSRWEDPVDHVLVTLRARVGDHVFELPPAPRRAVGPDLLTFFRGESRVGAVERVTLRVHVVGSPRARALKSGLNDPPGPNASETAAWERAVEAVRV